MSQASTEPVSSNDNNKGNNAHPHTQPCLLKHTIPSRRSLLIDVKYPESALRTPLYALPFPHPKWGVNPQTGQLYEDTSLMVEASRENLGNVRESIEEDVEEKSRERRKKACENEAEGEGGGGGKLEKDAKLDKRGRIRLINYAADWIEGYTEAHAFRSSNT